MITTGKHFNAQLLVEAFRLFDQNYGAFGNFNSRQNNLFWCKVIGYIQRFLPACYAQAFAQGVYHIVEKGEELNRSFDFRFGRGSYFPLDSNSKFRLGYNYAIGVFAPAVLPCPQGRVAEARRGFKIMSSKNSWIAQAYAESRSAGYSRAFSNVASVS